jgi:hypothetical protein
MFEIIAKYCISKLLQFINRQKNKIIIRNFLTICDKHKQLIIVRIVDCTAR